QPISSVALWVIPARSTASRAGCRPKARSPCSFAVQKPLPENPSDIAACRSRWSWLLLLCARREGHSEDHERLGNPGVDPVPGMADGARRTAVLRIWRCPGSDG